MVDLAQAAMQSQGWCIAQGRDWVCRGVLGDWEVVVGHWNIVFARYSPGEPCAARIEKPSCWRRRGGRMVETRVDRQEEVVLALGSENISVVLTRLRLGR